MNHLRKLTESLISSHEIDELFIYKNLLSQLCKTFDIEQDKKVITVHTDEYEFGSYQILTTQSLVVIIFCL